MIAGIKLTIDTCGISSLKRILRVGLITNPIFQNVVWHIFLDVSLLDSQMVELLGSVFTENKLITSLCTVLDHQY